MSTLAASHPAAAERRTGLLLVGLSTLAWSFSGIFARLLTVDVWTAICLRSAFGALIFGVPVLVHRRGDFWGSLTRIGGAGLLTALAGIVSMFTYIGALYQTSVADVTIIYSVSPFLSAGLAWVWLRERPAGRTLACAGLALVGVVVMVSGSLGTGRLAGDLLAFVMSLCFAVMSVTARARRALDLSGVMILTALGGALAAWPLASPLTATRTDLVVLALFAFFNLVVGYLLYMEGAKRIPAAEAGLVSTTDIVIAPLWVFLLFGENPGLPTIVGGAIVLAAVLFRIFGDLLGPGRTIPAQPSR